MSKLVLPSSREQVIEKDRTISRAWGQWLRQLSQRLGYDRQAVYQSQAVPLLAGASATSTTPLSSVPLFTLPDATTAAVVGRVRLPHNLAEGSSVTPFAVWLPDGDASADDIEFRLNALRGAVGSAATESTETKTVGGTGEHVLARTEFEALEDCQPGEAVAIELERLAAGSNDTFAGPVCVVAFGLLCSVYDLGRFARFP